MLCIKNPTIRYDSQYDIMYYVIGDTSNSYGDEYIDNIVALKDFDTDEITGFTIMNFGKICKSKSSEYAEVSKLLDIQKAMSACGM